MNNGANYNIDTLDIDRIRHKGMAVTLAKLGYAEAAEAEREMADHIDKLIKIEQLKRKRTSLR